MKLPNASPFFPPTPADHKAALACTDSAGKCKSKINRSKGISLTEEELKTLKGILDDMEL